MVEPAKALLETRYLPPLDAAGVDIGALTEALNFCTAALYYRLLKRAFDVALAGVLLLALAAPLVLVAAAIRLETPGPVFFRQLRLGRGLRRFHILKFRTMHEGAAARPTAVLDPVTGRPRRISLATDARLTRVGYWLRRFSIDELPQVVNIVVGDMSFVGPRPLAEPESLAAPLAACVRYSVPAGLTGLAQIRDRKAIYADSRFDADIEYAATASLLGDLAIMVKTLPKIHDKD